MSNAFSKVRESRFDHQTRFLRPRNRVEIKNTRLEVLWSRVRCWQRGSRDHGVACTLSRRDFSPVKVASMITNATLRPQRRVTRVTFDPSPFLMVSRRKIGRNKPPIDITRSRDIAHLRIYSSESAVTRRHVPARVVRHYL